MSEQFRNIVERVKIDTPYIQIHAHFGTPMQSGEVRLALWTHTSSISKMMHIHVFHMGITSLPGLFHPVYSQVAG